MKNYTEAIDSINKRLFLNRTVKATITPIFNKHCQKWDFFKQNDNFNKHLKQGNLFLYEQFSSSTLEVTYPRIGIYLHEMICDQTLEIEWVNYRRIVEYNLEEEYSAEFGGQINNYKTSISDHPSKVNSMILWSDSMLVYGIWDKIPDWRTLKRSYEKTWWFKKSLEEERNIKINQVI